MLCFVTNSAQLHKQDLVYSTLGKSVKNKCVEFLPVMLDVKNNCITATTSIDIIESTAFLSEAEPVCYVCLLVCIDYVL